MKWLIVISCAVALVAYAEDISVNVPGQGYKLKFNLTKNDEFLVKFQSQHRSRKLITIKRVKQKRSSQEKFI